MSELEKALVKAQSEFPEIPLNKTVKVKTRTGSEYTFSYATLPHIKRLTDPVLHKNGLCVLHLRDGDKLISTLLHVSGEKLVSTSNLRIHPDSSQQDEGSVLTYQKRYNHTGLLGIMAEEDDDGNIARGNKFEYKEKPAKPNRAAVPPPDPKAATKTETNPKTKKDDFFAQGTAPANDKTDGPNYKFLEAMKAQKKRIGDKMYYEILGLHGYEKSSEITSRSVQKSVYQQMKNSQPVEQKKEKEGAE